MTPALASRRLAATFIGAMAALVLWLEAPARADEDAQAREYVIKAAFLYNFAKFVDWPEGAFANSQSPLVLCIQGDPAFASAQEAISGKTVQERPLRIVQLTNATNPADCQIAFLSAGGRAHWSGKLGQLNAQKVLTVGDAENFVEEGGMVGLVTIDNKIRFDVNLTEARRSGLRISSTLLKLARKVQE